MGEFVLRMEARPMINLPLQTHHQVRLRASFQGIFPFSITQRAIQCVCALHYEL